MPKLINGNTLIPPFSSGRNVTDERWDSIFGDKKKDYFKEDKSRDGRTPYRSGFKRYNINEKS